MQERFGLTTTSAGDSGAQPEDTAAGAGTASPSRSTATDTRPDSTINPVPNTGGVANAPNMPAPPLSSSQLDQVRTTLEAALHADQGGDGTMCAQRIAEARRIAAEGRSGQR